MKSLARSLPFCLLSLITASGAVHARGSSQELARETMPVVLSEVKPDYTPEAKKQGIQGIVESSVVVRDDGAVGEVKVTRSLDDKYGLDEQAVIAMKKWRFRPGTKDGKPVAEQVTVEVSSQAAVGSRQKPNPELRAAIVGARPRGRRRGAAGAGAPPDWPRFRGPNGTGVSSATGVPTEFGPGAATCCGVCRCRRDIRRRSCSTTGFISPAFAAAVWSRLAIDRTTGRMVWDCPAPAVKGPQMVDKRNNPASPSPAAGTERGLRLLPRLRADRGQRRHRPAALVHAARPVLQHLRHGRLAHPSSATSSCWSATRASGPSSWPSTNGAGGVKWRTRAARGQERSLDADRVARRRRPRLYCRSRLVSADVLRCRTRDANCGGCAVSPSR